jgi:hypothetical protein
LRNRKLIGTEKQHFATLTIDVVKYFLPKGYAFLMNQSLGRVPIDSTDKEKEIENETRKIFSGFP